VRFVQSSIEAIDLQQRQVQLSSGLHYDYSHLVLSLGCINGYFGIEGAQEHSFAFRSGQDAEILARQLRECLQRASQTTDPQERSRLLTVAIIGAGPSGIELAATLADLLPNWYAGLGGDPQEIRVVVLDRETEILGGATSPKSDLRKTAKTALKQRSVPVELCLNAEVSVLHPHQVAFKRNGQADLLDAATIVWTAGTATHPLIKGLSVAAEQRNRQGRLYVNDTLQLPDFPEVFAGGDCAVDQQNPLPPTAQVAYQQGMAIARNLKAISEGSAPHPGEVKLRGSLLKLGLGESAADIFNRFNVTGKLGHLIREAIYLELLPTPVHNFKATTEWLIDDIFYRYGNPMSFANAGEKTSQSA
ncbi:MAG TPA: NAD(P)/FAD-dependent oxidoreductase, partial [Candidatus Caenarcaniphilales bacterium]